MAIEALFTPIGIGQMALKNRVAMAPAATSLASRYGLVTEEIVDYYGTRARGGAGLVIVENTSVDFYRGVHSFNRLSIEADHTIPGLSELARAIKKNGAKAAIQLNHCGRMAKSKVAGLPPVAPSAVAYAGGFSPRGGETPTELAVEEIDEIVGRFARAAVRAREAGFDGIEVHASHGYLLAEFLSASSNRRDDRYGGTLGNRARILLEVLRAVRRAVGADYPMWYRINGTEYGMEHGLTLEEAQSVVTMTDGLMDAVHVSAWGSDPRTLGGMPDTPGALLPLAAAIKAVSRVPVIAVGRMTPAVAERAIREGVADVVAIARGLIAEPELPARAQAGDLEDIRPCITCYYCQDTPNRPVRCSVNAAAGREREFPLVPTSRPKRIAVVGGGPAGMEAARVLALRGHHVTLVEKRERLGGQLLFGMMPPHKRDRIEPLIDYHVAQLRKHNVDVRLGRELDDALLRELDPEDVVLATGATPLIPPIPGVERGRVVTAVAVLGGQAEVGQRVVVVGGGSTGCETAEFLVERGKELAVVEMLPEIASDMGHRDRTRLLSRLKELPIRFLTRTRCVEISDEGVAVTTEGKEEFVGADTVVLAVGSRSDNHLFPLLSARGLAVHMAGDCWHLGRIADAIGDGLAIGCSL